MNNTSEKCGDVRLGALLAEDQASDAYRTAAEHVEHCAACQVRLTTLAANDNWWSDAHTLLSGECEPRWQPDTSQSDIFAESTEHAAESIRDTVLSLLGAPGHPEMLGRLGRYDIERVIGSGGMGVVLKAHDSELNRPIAVKLLAPHLAHVGAARERFSREGRAAAAVVHEHVVAIYNVESGGPVPFLVMQYVPGRSLQTRVDEDGPLGVEEILRIGMQAASGLAAAHRQGLVHRDVKPSNILLENQVERAILTDFGLARAIDDASLTQTGILAGTPHYMSPEQATGGPIDHRSDLFSLGAVLYFMATGRPPFRATGTLAVLHRICRERHRPLWEINRDMPDELCDAIDGLLEKKPSRRPSSAEDVQQQLSQLLSRVQQQGLGRRRWRGWRALRARRMRWVAAIFAGVLLAAATTIGALRWWPATPVPIDVPELKRLEGDVIDVSAAMREAVNSTSTAAYYLQTWDDAWRRELESVQSEIAEFETDNSSFNP
jgi:eukaryotic-like serine/threonine-protein kinase